MARVDRPGGAPQEVEEDRSQIGQAADAGRREVASTEEEMPRVVLTRRQIVASALFVLSGIAFLYFVLPKLAGVGKTVHRIEGGDSWGTAICVLLWVRSCAG